MMMICANWKYIFARIQIVEILWKELVGLRNSDGRWKVEEKANLSKAERNQMKTIVTAIKNAEKEVQNGRK